jgi:hypothetical protein
MSALSDRASSYVLALAHRCFPVLSRHVTLYTPPRR